MVSKFIRRPRSFLEGKEWALDLLLLRINGIITSEDLKQFQVSLETKMLKRKKRKIPKAAKKELSVREVHIQRGDHSENHGYIIESLGKDLGTWRLGLGDMG